MSKRKGHRKAPKVPLSKRITKTPPRKFPIKGHTKSSKVIGNGDSSVVKVPGLVTGETKVGTDNDSVHEVRSKNRAGDSGGLLTSDNPKEIKKDLRMIEGAVRKGWNIKRKNMIQRRLLEIMEKTHVSVPTKNGMVDCDGPADSNAIAAARVLVAMNGQDQTDDHLALKINDQSDQPNTVVNIHNNNVTAIDNRRFELARLANKLGARELLIDGESVPVTEHIGSTDSVQKD